jgi:ATP-dependent Clp protease ATP-binding subunit ClpA
VEEPSAERGRSILLGVATDAGPRNPFTDEGLDRLDRLHRRYATYSAYPGRPLRFLRNLLEDQPPGRKATAEDVTRAFARETGLPLFLLDEAVPLDLDATRRWFDQRVIGQTEAVRLVVDLLATVTAALTRPRKPIASLLFIGPTGSARRKRRRHWPSSCSAARID